MHIFSFDCADRTLGVCWIEVTQTINIRHIWVFDLIPDQKTVKESPKYLRLSRLKAILKMLNSIVYPDVVLVEYQMNINDLTNFISTAIRYEYCECLSGATDILTSCNSQYQVGTPKFYDIMPHWKKTICFDQKKELHYSHFVPKYKKLQSANKAHADANFRYYLQHTNPELYKIVQPCPKDKTNHVADAFLQAYWWIINQCK
jgi:hypothetical protein